MSEARFRELAAECGELKALYQSDCVRVYQDWTFFRFQGKDRCLKHTEAAKDPTQPLWMEIFAPILVEILKNREHFDGKAFSLNEHNLIIVLLNPTARSFGEMANPTQELSIATAFATGERSRITGKGLDLAESLRRVEDLGSELEAWKLLRNLVPNVIECLQWPHFEFRYSIPEPTLSNAQVELAKASGFFLKCVGEQRPDMVEPMTELMYTPDEIRCLSSVV